MNDATDDAQAATDALMAVSRLMTGIVARSLAGVEEQVSVPQFRVLVMLWASGEMNLSTIADGLGVNPSNASRSCDKLVEAGLIRREVDDRDRRSVRIRPTVAGRRFIDRVMATRRSMLAEVVDGLRPVEQRRLVKALTALIEEVERSEHTDRIGMRPGALVPWIM